MNHKLKDHIEVNSNGMRLNMNRKESSRTSGTSVMITKKALDHLCKDHFEEFILSEFDIDNETMEEHLQELLAYLTQNHITEKVTPD